MEEKKYEITALELKSFIGCAMNDVIPDNTKPEDEEKYVEFAAGIAQRVIRHLNGSEPFDREDLLLVENMHRFINNLDNLCKSIFESGK